MSNTASKRKSLGEVQSFRWPDDMPPRVKEYLEELKGKLGKNFSHKIAQYVIEGAEREILEGKPSITIPLDPNATVEEINWFQNEHTKNLFMLLAKSLTRNPIAAVEALNSATAAIPKEAIKAEEPKQEDLEELKKAMEKQMMQILDDNAGELDLGF